MTVNRPFRLLLATTGVLLRVAVGVILVVALVALGALAALQTSVGRVGAERLITYFASGPDLQLKVSGLAVSWGLDTRIAHVEVGDAAGVYLTLDGLALDWQPSALLSRRIVVDRARIERLYLARLPEASTEPADASAKSGGGGLPGLPAMRLAQAEIPEIILGEAVAGLAVKLAAQANARITADPQSAELNAMIARRDGTEGEINARLRFAPQADTLTFEITAREPRGGLTARLLDIEGLPAVDFTLKGDGPLDDWKSELALALDGKTEIAGTAAMAATSTGRRLVAQLSGEVAPLAPPIAEALLMGRTQLDVTAEIADDFTPRSVNGEITTDTLSAHFGGTLTGSGEDTVADLTADATVSAGEGAMIALELPERRVTLGKTRLDLAAKGPLAALDWSVKLDAISLETTEARISDLTTTVSGQALDTTDLAEPLPLALEARIGRLDPRMEGADPFAGPVTVSARASVDLAASSAEIENFKVTTRPVTVEARGTVSPDDLDTSFTLSASDLAMLDPRVGGGLVISGTAKGATAGPDVSATAKADALTLSGKPVQNLTLAADVSTSPGALSADLDLSATVDGYPVEGTVSIVPDGDGIAARTLRLASGDSNVTGNFKLADLSDPTGTLSGEIDIDAPDLSAFSALALTELAGALEGKATLSLDDGSPVARLTLSGHDIAAAGATIGTLSAEATATTPFTTPTLRGKARAGKITAGGQDIATLDLTASTQGATTDVTLDARLASGERADGVALTAHITPTDDGFTVALDSLDGRYLGLATRLAEPARIVSAGKETRIETLGLRLGDGRLTISGTAADRLDIKADIASVPLALANAFAPGFGIAGTASGVVTVGGAASDPAVDWRIALSGLSAAQLRANGIDPLAVSSTGQMRGNRITQTTQVSGSEGLSLVATGPVTLGTPGSLSINLSGTVPLATARQKLILSGFSGEGALALSGTVSGALTAPRYAISLTPRDVRLTQLSSGLTLQNFSGNVAIDNAGVAINALKAGVAAGGSLSVNGRIGLDGAMPADLSVTLASASYTDGRIVQATVDADLKLSGPLADVGRSALLSGTVKLARADISIPSSLPGAIDPLTVTHINAPASVRAQDLALQGEGGGDSGGGGKPISLDVTVTAPGRIFVRGRGLDAEMGGTLRIVGTTANPQAVGSFDMRRGILNVLTRRVVFDRGIVTFSGSLDPRLDFLATSQTSAGTVTITVSGPAQRPNVAFTSSPQLPQDEVLAQFLFGRSMSQLSPVQIAQLGASVLALTGGSSDGPLGSLRKSLGVDMIDIDTSGDGSPSLAVGKYLSDNIYLGVKQGTSGESSRVTVDIDVTKSLKLRGEVGADGESKAGIFFEREFGK
ncbi:translocation/assembly module TamB domain-containing protein [Stappia sp. ICDLI1TA098]